MTLFSRFFPLTPSPLRLLASGLCTAALIACSGLVASAQTVATPSLPGGASSLQETFSDWQVGCVVREAAKRCAITQEQSNQQTRQRVLAIELSPVGDRLEGVLLMPFGLLLERGVTLQIDDQPATIALKIRTCLPGGCLVPLTLDGKTASALRTGKRLKVRATPDGGGQELNYAISLRGLTPGLERVATLLK